MSQIKTNTASILSKVILVIIITAILMAVNIQFRQGQQFTLLAESFLSGKLYFLREDLYGTLDMVPWGQHYYWHLGPFPAVILMPFVLVFHNILGFFFYQGFLQPLFSLGVFLICFKLAKMWKFSGLDSFFLSLGFFLGSVFSYIAINSESWYFSQNIAVLLSLWALYEYYFKKRLFFVGVLVSLAFATRFTAGFILLFFLADVITNNKLLLKDKLGDTLKMLLPVSIIGLTLLLYNQIRFNDIFDNGYVTNLVAPEAVDLVRARYGLFSLNNIATNFYWYFLAPIWPVVEKDTYHLVAPYIAINPYGFSFFFVSPLFIKVFKNTYKTREQKLLWGTSLFILFVLLSYYATGYYQYGPRYMLDILPLLYILLLESFTGKKLGLKWKILVIVSSVFNLSMIINFLAIPN